MSERTADRFEPVAFDGGVWIANPPCRAVIIGVGGVIEGKTERMEADLVTKELPAGYVMIGFSSITEAGTTADEITALW